MSQDVDKYVNKYKPRKCFPFPMFFIQEPSVDASYGTSGPEGHHDSRTSSGAADSLHSNGKSSSLPARTRRQRRGCGTRPPLRACSRLSATAKLMGEERVPISF